MSAGVLAVQAGALRAAAQFIEDAAVEGVTVAVCGDGEIRLLTDRHAGPPATRIDAAASLASHASAGNPQWSPLTRALHATGQLDGHKLAISAFINDGPQGEPAS